MITTIEDIGEMIKDSHDIPIIFSGLRAGEKLFEELLIGKDCEQTSHPRILTSKEVFLEKRTLDLLLEQLSNACLNYNKKKLREILFSSPISDEENSLKVK